MLQRAYDFDFSDEEVTKEVVSDADEPPLQIAVPRTATKDLAVHVVVDGHRHRRAPDLATTSCGAPIHSQFHVPLREELTHRDAPLSRDCGCFTPFELAKADAAEKAKYEP